MDTILISTAPSCGPNKQSENSKISYWFKICSFEGYKHGRHRKTRHAHSHPRTRALTHIHTQHNAMHTHTHTKESTPTHTHTHTHTHTCTHAHKQHTRTKTWYSSKTVVPHRLTTMNEPTDFLRKL